MSAPKILVLGYGNPGREDDGLGPAVVEALEALDLSGVTVDADYQLNVEDAAALAEHDIVLFVDASVKGPDPYSYKEIGPASEITFTSHSVSPESVVAMSEDHFGKRPRAYVLAIRGHRFEFAEGLTPQGQKNLKEALAYIQSLIQAWKEQLMDTNTQKTTILTIDDDPDIRRPCAWSLKLKATQSARQPMARKV